MEEADFNQFVRLRNQLVIAENYGGEENLSTVLMPTMTQDMVDKLRLAHKQVDVVYRPYRKTCVTLLRNNLDKSESSYAPVRLFARKKENEKFQQIFYVKSKFEEFIYLLDVMNSVYEKGFPIKPICNVL